jgi:hypothetical protein
VACLWQRPRPPPPPPLPGPQPWPARQLDQSAAGHLQGGGTGLAAVTCVAHM